MTMACHYGAERKSEAKLRAAKMRATGQQTSVGRELARGEGRRRAALTSQCGLSTDE